MGTIPPDSFTPEVQGDPVPLPPGEFCPDRTHCGTGRGHAGRGWKTGVFGLRETGHLSGCLPRRSLDFKIKSIPHMDSNKAKTNHLLHRN